MEIDNNEQLATETQEIEVDAKKKGRKPKPPKPEAKIVWKGQQEFRHDLHKLQLSKCLKNTSWKKGVVSIQEVEHVHFFHSHNSQGKEQQFTNSVAGHYHEITKDPDGNMACSPPITDKYRKTPNGQKRTRSKVSWIDEVHDREVVDNHTHKIEYQFSEMLNKDTIRSTRQANHAQTQMMQMQSQAAALGFRDTDE